jgi:hypothetical protein
MAILLTLMVFVFKNDFEKQGDVILGQLRELIR